MISCSSIAYSIEYMFKIYCKAQPRHVESCIEWKQKKKKTHGAGYPQIPWGWISMTSARYPTGWTGYGGNLCDSCLTRGPCFFFPAIHAGKWHLPRWCIMIYIWIDSQGTLQETCFFPPRCSCKSSLQPMHLLLCCHDIFATHEFYGTLMDPVNHNTWPIVGTKALFFYMLGMYNWCSMVS